MRCLIFGTVTLPQMVYVLRVWLCGVQAWIPSWLVAERQTVGIPHVLLSLLLGIPTREFLVSMRRHL